MRSEHSHRYCVTLDTCKPECLFSALILRTFRCGWWSQAADDLPGLKRHLIGDL